MEKLRCLLGMLDDPNENAAVSVMAELLRYGQQLQPLLGEMQEAENKLLRKRIQQLQTILHLQKRRKDFLQKISGIPLDLTSGLIELHLLWFDRDTPESLQDMLQTFQVVAANNQLRSLEELGSFMARNGFALPPPEEALEPENYCIGPILEDRIGADVMLCTLAMLAGLDAGLELALVRLGGRFAIVNSVGEMISPANDWLLDRNNRLQQGDFWADPRMVLRYASLMLFLYAVGSDNFRYIHTIAHALDGGEQELLDFLPYPYNGQTQEEKHHEIQQ